METILPSAFLQRTEAAVMASVAKEEALKNALASSAMEGFPITPEVERDCHRLLNGEVDVDTLVKELLNQKQ